jgi:hypothetical protein
MLNVPQRMRNQIAETGLMLNPILEEIFRMEDEEEADEKLLELARKQVGLNKRLVNPWIGSAILLIENEAITAFTEKNPDLRLLLPEILTMAEDALVAQGDYLLNRSEPKLLIKSYSKPLK